MLMLNFHIAFALGLIALSFGTAVLIWSKVHATSLAKIIGYIIVILTVANLVCMGNYIMKSWKEGCFDLPLCPMIKQMQMMQGQGPMMGKPMMMPGQMMPPKMMMPGQTMPKATSNKK